MRDHLELRTVDAQLVFSQASRPFKVLARGLRRGVVSAQDAFRLGMVNHVVGRENLSTFTLELAAKIAQKPLFALKLAKEAVNTAQDNQGRVNAMQASFALHQLCHSHNQQRYGILIDPAFLDSSYGKAVKTGDRR